MALPLNIDDLIHQRKVESARIEYKKDWNPEKVLHSVCAFANDIGNWGVDAIIALITENPSITHDDLSKRLGRARSTVIEQISKLKALGRLRRVGPDKGGHWEVIGNA